MQGRIINPAEMTADDSKVLAHYVTSSPTSSLFINQDDPSSAQPVPFHLPGNLIFWQGVNGPDDYGYELVRFEAETKIGEGTFAQVFKSDGTTKIKKDAAVFERSTHAIKWQQHVRPLQDQVYQLNESYCSQPWFSENAGQCLPATDLESECEHSRIAGLDMKHPTYVASPKKNIIYSFTVMDYIEGEELFYILSERNKEIGITLRLELCQALLKAYKEQIFDKKRIHLDIKPENVKVVIDYAQQRVISVKFLDYSFCIQVGDLVHLTRGSISYIAPEICTIQFRSTGPYQPDQSADFYSFGKMLGLVMGADQDDIEGEEELTRFLNILLSKDYTFAGLYSGISRKDINQEERDLIENLLSSMVKLDPSERLRCEDEAQIPKEALLQFRLEQCIKKIINLWLSKFDQAVDLKLNNRLNQLASYYNKNKLKEHLRHVQSTYNAALRNYTPDLVAHFVEKLQIQAFIKMVTKEGVSTELQSLFDYLCTTLPQLPMESEVLKRMESHPSDIAVLFAIKDELQKVQPRLNEINEQSYPLEKKQAGLKDLMTARLAFHQSPLSSPSSSQTAVQATYFKNTG